LRFAINLIIQQNTLMVERSLSFCVQPSGFRLPFFVVQSVYSLKRDLSIIHKIEFWQKR
jgi:hypothetical protein